jgi:hypothetical protein
MVEHVPDAGFYAPVTILIDEDRKIEGGKIATQCLYRATMQYNCVALQLQNLPAKG